MPSQLYLTIHEAYADDRLKLLPNAADRLLGNCGLNEWIVHIIKTSIGDDDIWFLMFNIDDSVSAGTILVMGSAYERRRYNVTSCLIHWAHIQNDPWSGF